MAEIVIKSSLINDDDFRFLKNSLVEASKIDGKDKFRVRCIEYINDSSSDDEDIFFYDMLEFVRFLKPGSNDAIAYTTPDHLIYLNMPNKIIGENVKEWDFTYDHECLHQLWDTFGVANRITKEYGEYDHNLLNIASDCVINDYLYFYRKKSRPKDLITPEYISETYGVEYDRKIDTQFTLYLKLKKVKDEQKKLFDQMMNDPIIKKALDDMNNNNQQNNQSGSSGSNSSGNSDGNSNGNSNGNSDGNSNSSGSNQGNKEDNMTADEAAASAQKSADEAKDAADNAKKIADKSGNDLDKKYADKAREEADKAQHAADDAKKAATNGDDKEANKKAKEAKEAADKAKEAADKTKKPSTVNTGKGNNDKEVNPGKNNNDREVNPGKNNNDREKGEGSKENEGKGKGQGNEMANNNDETKEDLDKIRKKAADIIDKYKNKISGEFGKFINKCKKSLELKESGLSIGTEKGQRGWNQEMNSYINSYVKKKVFQKRREYELTYKKMHRRAGYVKWGEPIKKGKKLREEKLTINVAFYIDRSGSMDNCINDVFTAAYTICESLKKQFGKEKVVDEVTFKMHAFDTEMHTIKFGNNMAAGGGTMDFDRILEYINKNTKEYLINVIITDAGFSINETETEKFIKNIDGMVLFITNVDSKEMKDLAKKYDTQLFYVLADSNFTLK